MKIGFDTFDQNTALSHLNQRKRVDIKPLKVFALEKLPKNCVLRNVMLTDKELLDVDEFLAKMEIWLKLLREV